MVESCETAATACRVIKCLARLVRQPYRLISSLSSASMQAPSVSCVLARCVATDMMCTSWEHIDRSMVFSWWRSVNDKDVIN